MVTLLEKLKLELDEALAAGQITRDEYKEGVGYLFSLKVYGFK